MAGGKGIEIISAQLRYRDRIYRIENGFWRGPDGHVVHLLTWITDDLERLAETAPQGPDRDLDAARKVAVRLGGDAAVVED